MGVDGIRAYGNADSVVYDIKYLLDSTLVDDRL
jgi:hypothetical protein